MIKEELDRIEIEDPLDEDPEESAPFRYGITSYGADIPVDGVVKRINNSDIFVPPFQRQFVWTKNQASRFIESLLLGLPVPGIFLYNEEETKKLMIIDGQQRLRTLQFFYNGVFKPKEFGGGGEEFELVNLKSDYKGLTFKTLSEEDIRVLDNSIIHATIIKQDAPSKDKSSIYYIFERLNTGGTLLAAQEIRACVYHGSFNDQIRDMNLYESWRGIFGPIQKRLKDQELILRFLSLYYNRDNYSSPMKKFLNNFMEENRELEKYDAESIEKLFFSTIDAFFEFLGKKAFRPERIINAAVFDAVMVGVGTRLSRGPIKNKAKFEEVYMDLLKNDDFIKVTSSSTANEENVKKRLSYAIEAFDRLK